MPTLRRPTSRRHQRGLTAWRGRCKCNSAQTRIHDASGRIIALHFLQKPADPQSAAHIFYLHNAQGQRIFKSTAQAHNKDPYNLIPSGNGWNDFWNRFANWWRKLLHIQPLPQGLQGTAFVYDEAGNLLGEYSSTEPAQDTEYIWLPTQSGTSLPVALIQGGQTYAIHSDHLGTPRIITNAQAQVVWQWEYSGFGEEPPQTTAHAPNGFQFKLRFPGQYADAESGLFYNWHRSYDPNTGRYTQPDPIGLGGGWNRFAYVDNNAIWASDPMGLQAYMCSAGLAAWCPPPPSPPSPKPIHGEWCGPYWTGGQPHPYINNPTIDYQSPISPNDAACMRHDMCYASCRETFPCDSQKRAMCMTECDRILGSHTTYTSPKTPLATSFAIKTWMNYNQWPDPGENDGLCTCKN